MPLAHHAAARQRLLGDLVVVGDEELFIRRLGEPLRAAPRHVLHGEERPVVEQDHVEEAVADDGALAALDDARQYAEPARRAVVRPVDEDILASAFSPGLDGGIDRLLHIRPVEVDLRAGWEVVEGAREAERVVEEGAGRCDLVDVEAGIDEKCRGEDVVEDVAVLNITVHIGRRWERAFRWEDKVLVDEGGIVAGVGAGVDVGEK